MKQVAVICDHRLSEKRIGGMEHFYKMFDARLKAKDVHVDWYFTNYDGFDFLKDLHIVSASGNSVEKEFINHSKNTQKEYDVIVTHFTTICSSFYKIYRQLHPKAEIIAVDHNPRPIKGFTLRKRIKNYIKGFLYAKYINKFIAVSEYSKKHLCKDFTVIIKDKIEIVLNGISTEKIIQKATYDFSSNFIVTAHLRKIKGIQDIILAVKLLPKLSQQKIKITIFGEGPYESELKNMVEKYNLGNQIAFKGSVNDLHNRYTTYDYLIHASYGETYCYSVVESLTAKVPVITTKDIGNVLQLVKEGQNGFLFNAGDYHKLSEILHRIISSEIEINEETFSKAQMPNMSLERMVDEHINSITCI